MDTTTPLVLVYETFARAYGVTAHIRRESQHAFGVRLFRGGRHLAFSYEHEPGSEVRPVPLGEVIGALATHLASAPSDPAVERDRARFARLLGDDGVSRLLHVHALVGREQNLASPSVELREALASIAPPTPVIQQQSMTA